MKFFIAGSTGFIGRHLIDALGDAGHSVKCLARTDNKALLCERVGFNAVIGDITDRESIKGKMDGCDIAVNLVGIIEETGSATFENVHIDGTRNFVLEAQKAGIKHIFYQSALGASKSSWAKYYKTKAEAEDIVASSGITYTIFRPSLVVGKGDGFTKKIKELIKLGPFVPVPGNGNAKFQPVYVGDWLRCFMKVFSNNESMLEDYGSRIYEFGGPEHLTYDELVIQLMEAMDVVKPLVHVPMALMKLSLPFSGIADRVGKLFGKKIPSATKEQLLLLQFDNICDRDSIEKLFGFTPMRYKDALKEFV